MNKALICGVNGQDGSYLARLLLEKGYKVFGTSRDAQTSTFGNLLHLGIREDVQTMSMAPNDFRSVLQALKDSDPDEIYNLAGQSSVGLSFEQPVETMDSIALGTLNLLEAIRFVGGKIRLYNAGSSECFGDIGNAAADEGTPFRPRSPYAVAKCAAHWQVASYREAYGLYACTGILFNHESFLRPARFVTKKVIEAAKRIAAGSEEKLLLGNIKIVRDWGWAPEYVDVMWRMLQQEKPGDFVIATGKSVSLEYFVERAFSLLDLDYKDYVEVTSDFMRPSDHEKSYANPRKALVQLDWHAIHDVDEVVKFMIEGRIDAGDP